MSKAESPDIPPLEGEENHKPPGAEQKSQGQVRDRIVAVGSLFATGLGIGFLAGLSVSPVIAIVISGLLAAISIIPSVLASFSDNLFSYLRYRLHVLRGAKEGEASVDEASPSINPTFSPDPNFSANRLYPTAVLVLGVTAGSLLGIYLRNINWPGRLGSSAVMEQRLEALGIPIDDVQRQELHGYLDKEIEYWSDKRKANTSQNANGDDSTNSDENDRAASTEASVANELFNIYFSQATPLQTLTETKVTEPPESPGISEEGTSTALYEMSASTCDFLNLYKHDPERLAGEADKFRSDPANSEFLEQAFGTELDQAYADNTVLAGALFFLCSQE